MTTAKCLKRLVSVIIEEPIDNVNIDSVTECLELLLVKMGGRKMEEIQDKTICKLLDELVEIFPNWKQSLGRWLQDKRLLQSFLYGSQIG